ncbi:hypothetical protein SNE40_000070 [Patella caerulea]|uniref:AIG1-type G domain-containing protein n=1 Tax=Patella caerulea TaxID=87958 RepID=A0AAN8KDM3_PATCE
MNISIKVIHFTCHISDEIRVVLIGKTGSGKSLFGNNLLQKESFRHGGFLYSVTKQCQLSQRRLDDTTTLSVVDTPGVFDTKVPRGQINKEIAESIVVATPGPHVYIFVIAVERYTPEQTDTVANLLELFGEEVVKHAIVVFTRKNEMSASASQTEFIRGSPDSLQNLLQRCENRYAFIDNKASKKELQEDLDVILDLIYKTIGENKGDFYTNYMYKKVNELLEARGMEIETEKEDTEKQLLEKQGRILEDLMKVNREEMERNQPLNDFRDFSDKHQENCRTTKKLKKCKRTLTLKMKAEDRQLITRANERKKDEEELLQCDEQMSRLEEDDKKLESKLEKRKEQLIGASADPCLAQAVLKLVEVNEKFVENDRKNPNREAKKEVLTDEEILTAVGRVVMGLGLNAGSAACSIGSGIWERLKKRWS